MSDAEHLNVGLVAASLLDSLDDFGVVVLDVPVLDAGLFDLARMVDQVGELVWKVSVACWPSFVSADDLTLADGFLLSVLESHRLERLVSVALVESIYILE